MSTLSGQKKKLSPHLNQNANSKILSQAELRAWWPFTRLDPSRFPKTKHEPAQYEDALL